MPDQMLDIMTSAERFERDRQQSFRQFEVLFGDGDAAVISAHYHQIDEIGSLCFYTIEASERRTIKTAFAPGYWLRLTETTSAENTARMNENFREQTALLAAQTRAAEANQREQQEQPSQHQTWDEDVERARRRPRPSKKKYDIH